MTVTTVEVRVSRKRSHNYHSTEFSFGYTAQVGPGEDPEAARAALTQVAKAAIREEFAALGQWENGEAG